MSAVRDTEERDRALLERETELDCVEQCVDALRAGVGGAVVLEGPAGIGKTGVLMAGRANARAAGVKTLTARGTAVERDLSYGVVRQLLEPLVNGSREQALSGAASLAAPVFTGTSDWVTPTAAIPEDRSFAVMHGLHWLCSNVAETEPLLLLVDDAHCADFASLAFLGYLARRLEGMPVAMIVAARNEGSDWNEAVGELTADPWADFLSLRPLTAEGVAKLLQDALGVVPEPRFAATCHEATGGSPFLLRALASALRDDGISPCDADVDRVRRLGPKSIARKISRRVRDLGPEAVQLAHAAAVLGPGAQVRHAAALAGLSTETASEVADRLSAVGVLEDGRPLAFVHAIVRRAIEAELPAGDRGRLHSRAARLLVEERVSRERVAGHLLASEPAGEGWVVDALVLAAQDALVHGAPRSAIAYLRRALTEPPRADVAWSVLRDLGFAESYARDPRAIGHLEQALQFAPDDEALAGTTLALGRMLQLAGNHHGAMSVYEAALPRIGGAPEATQLTMEAALVAAALLDRSGTGIVANRLGNLRARAEKLADVPFNVFGPLALAAAGANEPAETVLALARRSLRPDHPLLPEEPDRPVFFYYACTSLMLAEAFDEAQGLLDRTVHDAQRVGSLPHFIGLSAFRGWLAQRRGTLVDAEADARISLAGGKESPAFFRSVALAVLIEVLIERGAFEEAERVIADAGLRGQGAESGVTFGVLLAALGRLALAAGRPADALADLRAAGQHMEAFHFAGPAITTWRSDAAQAHLALGDRDAALSLAEQEVELARAFGTPRVIGSALRAAGLVTGGDDGVVLLSEAVDHLQRADAALEHARALADLGAVHRRQGHRAIACPILRRALDLAYRCQAPRLAERARTELLLAGGRPRRPALTGVESLTPSEHRVAQMAASGRTNREIAQALFVTARTVEGHLTHVFQKLDLRGRNELAARFEEKGQAATGPP